MKRGDEIEIDIVDLDSKGDGRGASEGRDIIVRRAVLEIRLEEEL